MPICPTTVWLNVLEKGPFPFAEIYGFDRELQRDRVALLAKVLEAHLRRFGDGPIRVFRSPGRINLRGMHVDTHGGYLNLMTHQRETVVVARPSDCDTCVWKNIDPQFEEASFSIAEKAALGDLSRPWLEYITSNGVAANVSTRRGHWDHYLVGAMISLQHRFPGKPLTGLCATVGSDIPRGAALSSSHALCVTALLAGAGWNGIELDPVQGILAARDAEWYTGARSGVSDQGAMFLGRRGQLVNIALFADDLDVDSARYLDWPEDLCVLVADSRTQRSLSGKQRIDYTRNRFAYSMAMEILRQEMQAMGRTDTDYFDRFSGMTAEALGGDAAAFALLKRIPQEIAIEEMRQRYILPKLDETYAQYFGGVPEAERPTTVALRGPLLFGLTESERARVFYEQLVDSCPGKIESPLSEKNGGGEGERPREPKGMHGVCGSRGRSPSPPPFLASKWNLVLDSSDEELGWRAAASLMTLGHEGDRVTARNGKTVSGIHLWDDRALDTLIGTETPFWACPGDYRASSPVLDLLVDTALDAGALGASLTGAGIAGSILALCRREDSGKIAEALRACLRSDAYRRMAKKDAPLNESEIREAVVINQATQGAGELLLP